MPEYLSPGVYVEETPSGNKPIEGVSTSTAGLVGVTERGPVNVPQLVTSFGEYSRTFGGALPIDDFSNGSRAHCYLPHAVEGFFTNGGKRAYVTRVLPLEATPATRDMFFADPGVAAPGNTVLLRPAQQGSATTAAPPLLYVLDPANLALGDWVRIGDGSRAEYRRLVANPGAQARHVGFDAPLAAGHPAGTTIRALAVAPSGDALIAPPQFKLVGAVTAGATQLVLDTGNVAGLVTVLPPGTAAAGWRLIELGATPVAECVFATHAEAVNPTQTRVFLSRAVIFDHAAATPATVIETTGGTDDTLALPANASDTLVFLHTSPLPGDFTNNAHVAILAPGTDAQEAVSIGAPGSLPFALPGALTIPAGSVGRHVSVADDDRNFVAEITPHRVIQLDQVDHLAAGMALTFTNGAATQDDFIDAVDTTAVTVTLRNNLPWTPTGAVRLTPKHLTSPANAGSISITLDDRLGLAAGDVIRIGTNEFATLRSVPGAGGPAPDPGIVLLTQPLNASHASGLAGDTVRRQVTTLDAARQAVFTVLASAPGATGLLVTDITGFASGEVLQLDLPDGTRILLRVSGAPVAAAPREIEVDTPLAFSHPAGVPLVEREVLFEVRAIDAGSWGNRLQIAARDETAGLVGNTAVLNANPPPGPGMFSSLQLASITGAEPGSVLEMSNPDGSLVAGLLKVRAVDRTSRLVLLDAPGLTAAHMTALANAALLGQSVRVRSREFSLMVLLRQRPDPTTPSRDDNLLDQEVFRNLSMDPRHSRYVERIVGVTYTPGSDTDDRDTAVRRSDRRSEGASGYVRVRDPRSDAASVLDPLAIRLGPETLVDVLPSSLTRAARLPLSGGDDNVAGMDDAMYRGADSNEPAHRTGLYSLKNLLNVSLVSIPGQTTPLLQQSVIDHCEELRYRFAVLDGPPPPDDTLADVQDLRQQFDSHYAALYHPWLTIADPFPTSPALVRQFPVPPAGHVLGIMARVDDERGVHKAPGNEVVRGIAGLTRYFTKGEQDIVNPYPVNINLIRDFRPNNRALRVWGARCITSDNEFKYINVRRLLIFLEDSIDRGLQWVVFEPNAEPLWASVRRSTSQFLTTVWRNGALEGTTPEQGFFVKCDRTTMTRDDIDNGRLICVIGVAPVKPAEFVIIRIGLWTADADQ
jgi:phage tail sheath protein FI